MRSVLISMSVLTVALGFAACGGQVVSETETEVAVSAELERVIHIDVDTIECPADVSAEPGELFDCQVKAATDHAVETTIRVLNDQAELQIIGVSGG